MEVKRVLIIGATGLVGDALARAWRRAGAEVTGATFHCHPAEGMRRLDMRDSEAVARVLAELSPDFVACPAANPFVDYIETHPEETRQVNVAGTLNVLAACRARGVRMLFFSSDYVFDGEKGVYTEADEARPVNEYGRQKLEAETAVLAGDPRNIVVRTTGVYGWQWEPKNFVLQVLSRLRSGESLKVTSDVRYNPTYAENLAEVTLALVGAGQGGLFHAVGGEEISRYEFGTRVCGVFGLDAGLLKPVASSEFKAAARRPARSSLSTEKIRRIVAVPLWDVGRSLEHMRAFEAEWRAYAEKSLPKKA